MDGNDSEKKIVIVGGTGLVGRKLVKQLRENGHSVKVLTRNPKNENEYFWNPKERKMDESALIGVEILVNVSGDGIADKRWNDKRKKELYESRIGTNEFLFSKIDLMPELKLFVSSSGITCYGFDDSEKIYSENDPFGTDFISTLVKDWEKSADLFAVKCKVAKVRTAIVLDSDGGALAKMLPVINMRFGSPLGSGNQIVPWIHHEDLTRIFIHLMKNDLEGSFNASANCVSNRELTKTIAQVRNKPFWFPAVPAFLLKILFGEMSILLLKGVKVSNEKIKNSGFEFHYTELESALKNVLNPES